MDKAAKTNQAAELALFSSLGARIQAAALEPWDLVHHPERVYQARDVVEV